MNLVRNPLMTAVPIAVLGVAFANHGVGDWRSLAMGFACGLHLSWMFQRSADAAQQGRRQ